MPGKCLIHNDGGWRFLFPHLLSTGTLPLIFLDRLAAAETQVIIFVAVQIHHPAAMPERGPPAAPVFMGVIGIENEPASFHLCIAQLFASPAGHLTWGEWQVHMLGGVSMLIVDS